MKSTILVFATLLVAISVPVQAAEQVMSKPLTLVQVNPAQDSLAKMPTCSERILYFAKVAEQRGMPKGGQTAMWIATQVKNAGACIRG